MVDSYKIQISSNLIDQLADDKNGVKKRTKKPKPKPKISDKAHQPEKNVKSVLSTQKTSPNGGWPLQTPVFLPAPPAPPPVAISELEAIRSALQGSKRTLQELEKQEDKMIQELTQRAKELWDKEFKLPYQNPTPCEAERAACLNCYKEHAKDSLKCAQMVKSFAECARQAKTQGQFKGLSISEVLKLHLEYEPWMNWFNVMF